MKKYSLPLILIGCLLLYPVSGFAMPVSLNLLSGGLSILDSLFLIAVGLTLIGVLFLCIAFLKPEKEKPETEESFPGAEEEELSDEEQVLPETEKEEDEKTAMESSENEKSEEEETELEAEETAENPAECEEEKDKESETAEEEQTEEKAEEEPEEESEEDSGQDAEKPEPVHTEDSNAETKEEEKKEEEPVYPKLTLIGIRDNELKVLPLKQSVSIGRRRSCDLVLGDSTVSGLHCTILSEDGKVFVHDEDSTNGTFVNAKKITEKTELHKGDLLSLGRQEFRVGL